MFGTDRTYLRRHPARCADERVSGFLSGQIAAGREPRAYAEVGDLHDTIFAEQNIAGFDVAMNLAVVVEVLQTLWKGNRRNQIRIKIQLKFNGRALPTSIVVG